MNYDIACKPKSLYLYWYMKKQVLKNKYFPLLLLILLFVNSSSHLCAQENLSDAALQLTKQQVTYDPSYFSIDYPNGDVPANKGVCTDVIIRAYRKIGIDLQKQVHEDMRAHFSDYPQNWGLKGTDKNIDHRRVPNLMCFFKRHGAAQPITENASEYLPGDVVSWRLTNGLTHIGIVVDKKSTDGKRRMIVHNIGAGQVVEDCLFRFTIIGHYRYE